MLFGKRLRELRTSREMTQKDLAKLINVSKVSISFYESGTRMPSMETLIAISNVFKVDLEYLLGQDEFVVEEDNKEYGITMSNEEISIIKVLRNHEVLYSKLINDPERIITLLDKKIR